MLDSAAFFQLNQAGLNHKASDFMPLTDKRVLVVEDDALITWQIEEILREANCSVVGPAGTLAHALRLVNEEQFDAALIDINLHGTSSTPLARDLKSRGIRFGFVTGYIEDQDLPSDLRDVPYLTKPFDPADLFSLAQFLVGLSNHPGAAARGQW